VASARTKPINPLTVSNPVHIMPRLPSMNIKTLVALMAAHRAVSSQSDESCTVFDQAAVARMKHYLTDDAYKRDAKWPSAVVPDDFDGCC
jgi:hypothetical protein